MAVVAMPCELDICVCVSLVFFGFYVARLCLNDWAASTSAVDTVHAIGKLKSYVCVYEREICRSVICNVRRTDQLGRLLHYGPRKVNLLFGHCENKISFFDLQRE